MELNFSSPGTRGGLAVSDINESAGLEIINYYCGGITAYNNTGGLIWEFFSYNTECPQLYSGIVTPVVEDIDLSTPGLEILYAGINNISMIDSSGNRLRTINYGESASFHISPTVGELNDNSGLETVYVTNTTPIVMTMFVVNSTFDYLWNYSWIWNNGDYNYSYWNPDDLTAKTVSIGDVNGDGDNEVVLSLSNYSDFNNQAVYDHVVILDKNGNVLTDYVAKSFAGMYPLLLELDSSNDGLEIVVQESDYFKVINYLGELLYSYPESWATGPQTSADDINNDGYLELVDFPIGSRILNIYKTGASAANNIWPMYKHDLNQTGYQK